jgi:hypothetical protein
MATTVTLKPNAIDLSGSTSGTTTLQATAVAGTTTITLPAATDTLVGKATTDTLTNKTLTAPTLASANITTALTLTGASGTNGQVLTSAGTGAAPTWSSPSTTSISNGTSNVTVNSSGGTITAATNGTTAVTIDTSQNVGISGSPSSEWAGASLLQVNTSATYSTFSLASTRNPVDGNRIGSIVWELPNNTATYKTRAVIEGYCSGSTANKFGAFLTFSTAPDNTTDAIERMRILSTGQVLIDRTTNTDNGKVEIYGNSDGAFNPLTVIQGAAGSASRTSINFYRTSASASVGSITTTNTATAYNTSSDYRLKNNIAPITGALAKVAQLKPVTYKWKLDSSGGEGFIAHELAEVCPHAVSGEKDATREEEYEVTPAVKDEEGNITTPAVMGTRTVPAYQGIDTSFLVATLTAAIQELSAKNDALTARVVALEAK